MSNPIEKAAERAAKELHAIVWDDEAWNYDRALGIVKQAIREAVEASNAWRPIETAPKDGTRILIYQEAAFRPFEHSVAKWDEADGCWYTMPTRDYRLCCQPLGWRPLPDPPREGEET